MRRILHPLPEILLLAVCGTIAGCDDYEGIADWGAAHLEFLRRHLRYENGVPGERWLTILMNRIDHALFAAAFADWVRESWPDKAGLVAIGGKTSRRRHDRSAGAGPLHLVSAFATIARLVLAQESVPDKGSELAAIPPLLERLGAGGGLKGALVSIDAIATNADIAASPSPPRAPTSCSRSRPTSRPAGEVSAFDEATLDTYVDPRQGPRPHRGAPDDRAPRGRLALRRAPLPRRAAPARRRLPAQAEPASSAGAPPASRRATSSHPAPSPQRKPPRRCASTGRSRTACPGSSTSPSPTTSPASARVTAPGNMATVRHFALNLVRTAQRQAIHQVSQKACRMVPGLSPEPPVLNARHLRRLITLLGPDGGAWMDDRLSAEEPGGTETSDIGAAAARAGSGG